MPTVTKHILFIGDCTNKKIHLNLPVIDLLITSPPYFNAPFDYNELFQNYESFLALMAKFGKLYFKSLKPGGIAGINIDDMLIRGIKYPIISDTVKIFEKIGYVLQGRVVWKKPEGYIRISRRSGVLLQNPFPMYFYPDNIVESILIFQKPTLKTSESSKTVNYDDIWEITNVLPIKGRLEENIAAFPDELPKRLISSFTKEYAWICDPFLGSGTTMKVARELNRNSVGIEILNSLIPVIRKKTGFTPETLSGFFNKDRFIITEIDEDGRKRENNSNSKESSYSLLSETLEREETIERNYKYHLVFLDCRGRSKRIINKELSDLLKRLFPGRILVVYYDFLNKNVDRMTLNQLTDFIMQNGLRLRDKITVQHQVEDQWSVKTEFTEVCFNHCYYEVFIFQKGKFDYKSKTKHEKEDSLINKEDFQLGKWYLSLWEFKNLPRSLCDPIVTSRILELFLFNEEVVCSNIPNLKCINRRFILDYFNY
ncbi:MAG: DNA-methyltransferase [Candidatus Hermodarchaeota archaeon]